MKKGSTLLEVMISIIIVGICMTMITTLSIGIKKSNVGFATKNAIVQNTTEILDIFSKDPNHFNENLACFDKYTKYKTLDGDVIIYFNTTFENVLDSSSNYFKITIKDESETSKSISISIYQSDKEVKPIDQDALYREVYYEN